MFFFRQYRTVLYILSVISLLDSYADINVNNSQTSSLVMSRLYKRGKIYYENRNFKDAVKFYESAAKKGHRDAQYSLGQCYKSGIGVAKDDKQAFYWYKKAAEQGQSDAQYSLGQCYKSGIGVAKDEKQAFNWYKKAFESYKIAAEKGNVEAQHALGRHYESGYGVAKDDKQAFYWYKKAAEQDHGDSLCALGLLSLKKNVSEGIVLIRKAAEKNCARAQVILGGMYYYGAPRAGIEMNKSEGLKWLCKAARNGDATAKEILGILGVTW